MHHLDMLWLHHHTLTFKIQANKELLEAKLHLNKDLKVTINSALLKVRTITFNRLSYNLRLRDPLLLLTDLKVASKSKAVVRNNRVTRKALPLSNTQV